MYNNGQQAGTTICEFGGGGGAVATNPSFLLEIADLLVAVVEHPLGLLLDLVHLGLEVVLDALLLALELLLPLGVLGAVPLAQLLVLPPPARGDLLVLLPPGLGDGVPLRLALQAELLRLLLEGLLQLVKELVPARLERVELLIVLGRVERRDGLMYRGERGVHLLHELGDVGHSGGGGEGMNGASCTGVGRWYKRGGITCMCMWAPVRCDRIEAVQRRQSIQNVKARRVLSGRSESFGLSWTVSRKMQWEL